MSKDTRKIEAISIIAIKKSIKTFEQYHPDYDDVDLELFFINMLKHIDKSIERIKINTKRA